ncbi:MAG: NAD(P)-dependent oxidoreductase [Bacillota bacterium]
MASVWRWTIGRRGFKPMKVGLIGVGTMGSRMAANLIKAGFTIFARDLDLKREKKAAELGAEIAKSPGEVAESADVILLSLPMPSDVESVVCGEDGILSAARPGQVIVDLSTVDPSSTQRNAAKARQANVGYLDSPVLGRPQNCGNWTLPVGGDKADLEKCKDVLGTLAKKIIHVGPSGHGNIVKLLNNMMFGAINSVTAEIMAICTKLGMSPKVLFDAISESGAASVSNLFLELGPKMLNRDFSPLFTTDLLYKDLKLAISMAEEHGIPLLVAHSNQLVNEMARVKGLGAEDTSGVVKIYEELLGVVVCN